MLLQTVYSGTNYASPATVVTGSMSAGSLGLIEITAGSTDAVSSITDSTGQTWTLAGTPAVFTGVRKTWLYYLQNASSGVHTVTINFSGTPASSVIFREYNGTVTSGVLDTYAVGADTGYQNTHTSSATATLAQADELVIICVGSDGDGGGTPPVYSAGSGYGNISSTQSGTDSPSYTYSAMADKTVSATTAVSAAFNSTTYVQGQTIVATFKLAAAAAPTTTPSGLTVTLGDTENLVFWNDDAGSTATSYSVERSTTGFSGWTVVGTPATAYFLDTGLTNGTTYYYRVSGVNSSGTGAVSGSSYASAPKARPSAPADRWYPYGSPPIGFTQTNIRNWMRTHYDNWITYCFTQTGATQAGKGAWRVQVPDQTDPVSLATNGTFSEGIGYGMFVCAYMARWNNSKFDIKAQMYFHGFWEYYKYYRNGNGLMNWRIDHTGSITGFNGATDGDVDVAIALIVMHREFGSLGAVNYLAEAKTLINAIRDYEFLPATDPSYPNIQMNGDAWGSGLDRYMPDYFSPAWMRVFKWATNDSRWDAIINANYTVAVDYYYNNTSYGLIPDESLRSGAQYTSGTWKFGYNAIRRPWRLTSDFLWFGNRKAYNSMYRLGADIKSRSGGVVSATRAEPALDWSTFGGYTAQSFYAGYGIAALTNASIADFAGSVADYMNTNVPGESSYFGASLGMMALLMFAGEMPSPINLPNFTN